MPYQVKRGALTIVTATAADAVKLFDSMDKTDQEPVTIRDMDGNEIDPETLRNVPANE